MVTKPFYTSRTLWVNTIALAAIFIQAATGNEILLPAEAQAGILAFVNVVLRLITNQGLA